jgi:hypothetical protein
MVANKRQHWVPDSYLRAWADPNRPETHEPFVHLFDRQGRGHRRKSPAKIFKMPDLYTIFSNGKRDVGIERHFARREQEFIKARRLIEAQEHGGKNEVAALYGFAAGMLARPPHKIDFISKQWGSIVAHAREIKIDPSVRPLPHLHSAGDERGMTIDEAQQLADDPMGTWFPVSLNAHYDALIRMFKCNVLVNLSPHPFLTSDSPAVISYDDGERRDGLFPRGLGSVGCKITMPISPKHALKFTHGPFGVHEFIPLDWDGVFEVNFHTVTRARLTIVSDRDDLFFVQAILDRVAEVEGGAQNMPPA